MTDDRPGWPLVAAHTIQFDLTIPRERAMNLFHILVPTDFSDCSQAALECAVELARRHPSAKLTLLHVEPGIVPLYDEELGVLEPSRLLSMMKMRVAEQAIRDDVAVNECLKHGDPTDEIVGFANGEEVELIVMGTHGRTGLNRLVLGSVSDSVLRRAPCPVLFVKEKPSDQTSTDPAGEQRTGSS